MCKIIVIEGGDSVGKQTQSEMLAEALSSYGFNTELVSFPRYDTYWGKKIKKVLMRELHTGIATLNSWYDYDRREYMFTTDLSELDFLVVDRYVLSNLAFGMAQGLEEDFIFSNQSSSLPKADVTFILDLPPELAMLRKQINYAGSNIDKNETNYELQKKVRDAYKYLTNKLTDINGDDELIYTIDANSGPLFIHLVIFDYLVNLGYLDGVTVYDD
jgi:dTMP kinase